eukprot:GCRY01001965.1.p1 GENE.GCRY01001965.1~~GCRY01001965.1.p1  ORF type:complete len:239 (+),score=25.90 GCRY01001965.1:224-940(+)
MGKDKPLTILFTQCIQRDFIEVLEDDAELPNQLHVGHSEAKRLLGKDGEGGPVKTCLDFAGKLLSTDCFHLIHVRDWHDMHAPEQRQHMNTFGPHCLGGTRGSEFLCGISSDKNKLRKNEYIINGITLNDFEMTDLAEYLEPLLASHINIRCAVIGAWTNVKVFILLSNINARYGITQLATCGALDSAPSPVDHMSALRTMQSVGITVFDTVEPFLDWLAWKGTEFEQDMMPRAEQSA